MRVHGPVRSPRPMLKELGFPRHGPPLEPVDYSPSWLQRILGRHVLWDKPPKQRKPKSR